MTFKKDFDPEEYWQKRVVTNADIGTVGHRSFGLRFNSYIYRQRLNSLKKFIEKFNIDSSRIRVLDVGCGSGFYSVFWLSMDINHYMGVDISANSIQTLNEKFLENDRIEFKHTNIASKNFSNDISDSYDLVTVFDVFYHITEDKMFSSALENISNQTKNGGYLVIFDQLAAKDYSLTSHVKYRNRELYMKKFHENGFELVYATKLFQLLVHPLFGLKPLDFLLSGFYKLLGVATSRSDFFASIAGNLLFNIDKKLLNIGLDLPNNEILCFKKISQ